MTKARRSSTDRISSRSIRLPIEALVGLALIAPLTAAVVLSFSPLDAGKLALSSVEGYRALLAGGRIQEFGQIALRAVIATVIALTIAVPAAVWIKTIRRPPARLTALALLVAPWLVSDMLRAFGWQLVLSPDGPVSALWSQFTGAGPFEGLRYNHMAALIGLVSATLPAAVFATFAALPRPASSEWLAARELGAPRHIFRVIVLGHAKLGIAFGGCMTFLFCLFGAAEPQFLDGPTQTSMLTIASSLSNTGVSSLLAFGVVLMLLAVLACALFVLLYVILSRTPHHDRARASRNRPGPTRAGWLANGILDGAVTASPPLFGLVALVLCNAPVVFIASEAFRQPGFGGDSWSIESFTLLASSQALLVAVAHSVAIGAVVAVVAAGAGFILSLAVWNRGRALGTLLLMAAFVLMPGEVYSISLIQVAKVAGLYEGNAAFIVVGHLIWTLPFAVGGLMLANRGIRTSVLEAGVEYGRSPLSAAIGIVGRINRGPIAASGLLALTLSLNENIRASYLGGSLSTLGNEVYGRLQAGLLPENRGIFAVEFLLVATALVTAVFVLLALPIGRED
jgi:spermidine/putrescine transport system permease protein